MEMIQINANDDRYQLPFFVVEENLGKFFLEDSSIEKFFKLFFGSFCNFFY